MGRKDGVIFFQKQKPLNVSNVDALQQSLEMLRRKAEQDLFFLIRVVGHLAAGSILAFSVFFVLLPALFFHMTSVPLIPCIGFHLSNFFRYSASFPPLYSFSACCQ